MVGETEPASHTEFRTLPAAREITAISAAFNALPGMRNKHLPRSEHHFATLQPLIEDQLFLGRSYEDLFDQFEIMLALVHGDLNDKTFTPFWGPPGRFAYKERSIIWDDKPFTAFIDMVKTQGSSWPGFNAGFFNKSLERFDEVAQAYAKLIAGMVQFF